MAINEMIKAVEENIEKEILEIIKNAQEEKQRILELEKTKIDREFEEEKVKIQNELRRKIELEKIFIESETQKELKKTISENFEKIYSEVIKRTKQKLLSLPNQKEFLIALLKKSIPSLNKNEKFIIYLSQKDYNNFKEDIEIFLKEQKLNFETLPSEIEGGILLKQNKLVIDNNLDKIIEKFKPFIVNSVYKRLPKV
ncbi:MAG: V-type ATP synthase subunit E family protein [Brevinematia bacterium]